MTVSFYDLNAQTPTGGIFGFDQLKGKVVLIVNLASKCSNTPQYAKLQELYDRHHDEGFEIIGFPSNQFSQEPGSDAEIAYFCQLNYGITFPIMKKVDVNGDTACEVFKFLKAQKSGLLGIHTVKWNFEKFLVDREGKVVARYSSTTGPDSFESQIAKLLKQ